MSEYFKAAEQDRDTKIRVYKDDVGKLSLHDSPCALYTSNLNTIKVMAEQLISKVTAQLHSLEGTKP